MKNIKLIAVDLDGPLLVDTFSPIMHIICSHLGVPYTSELERNTLSRRREEVTEYLRQALKPYVPASEKPKSHEEMMQGYWSVRDQYMKSNKTGIKDGVPEFLDLLKTMGTELVCYGGLPPEYFRDELKEHAKVFSQYICTNEFRPGVKEIVADICKVEPARALFIDDVNFVAEHAKELGVPFIGVPAQDSFSWQRQSMQETGVPFIVDAVCRIDGELLRQVDERAGQGRFWQAGQGDAMQGAPASAE